MSQIKTCLLAERYGEIVVVSERTRALIFWSCCVKTKKNKFFILRFLWIMCKKIRRYSGRDQRWHQSLNVDGIINKYWECINKEQVWMIVDQNK